MNHHPQRSFEFGPFRLDPAERLLSRDGQTVPLPPKAFETLLVLVQHSGHLIEKDELMKTLWPDSYVEEANLNHHIWTLRKALGESQNGNRYIETVPRRGYRFVADVKEMPEEGEEVEKHTLTHPVVEEEERTQSNLSTETRSSRPSTIEISAVSRAAFSTSLKALVVFALIVGLVASVYLWTSQEARMAKPAVAEIRSLSSIAVLPFKIIGHESNEYLGIGMSDALITRLGNSRQIIVRPTSAVRRYIDPHQDPMAAGRQLGVDVVLDGSVQQLGDRIRVTVQLVRVDDRVSLWSGSFDEPYTDIFTVQDSISQRVMRELMIELSQEERERLQRRDRVNVEAYKTYMKGRYFWNKRTAEGFTKAIEHFNRAIEIDPYLRASIRRTGRFIPPDWRLQRGFAK